MSVKHFVILTNSPCGKPLPTKHLVSTLSFLSAARPSAKDQGITWVDVLVLVVLHHLVHFLMNEISFKKLLLPEAGIKPLTTCSTDHHSTDWATEPKILLGWTLICISRRRPLTSIGRHLLILNWSDVLIFLFPELRWVQQDLHQRHQAEAALRHRPRGPEELRVSNLRSTVQSQVEIFASIFK